MALGPILTVLLVASAAAHRGQSVRQTFLRNPASDAASDVSDGASEAGGTVADGASDAGGAVSDGASSAGSAASDAGSVVAEGTADTGTALADGATDTGSAVADGAASAGSTVTSGAAKYLPPGVFPDDSNELEGTDQKAKFKWGYKDTKAWGKEFKVCNEGKQQSPVDLPAQTAQGKETLWSKIKYHPVSGRRLKNNGHYLKVQGVTGAVGEQGFGGLSVPATKDFGGGFYKVKQLQFHFPSEHTVGGRHYAGEMQIVHRKESLEGKSVDSMSGGDSMLILSIFFDIVQDDDPSHDDNLFLLQLGFDHEKRLPKAGNDMAIPHQVDIQKSFEPQLKGHFSHYKGSLTAPPCSETVQWYLMRTPAGMSQRQLDMFRELRKNAGKAENNRPVQPLNDRKIETDHFSGSSVRALHALVAMAVTLVALRA